MIGRSTRALVLPCLLLFYAACGDSDTLPPQGGDAEELDTGMTGGEDADSGVGRPEAGPDTGPDAGFAMDAIVGRDALGATDGANVNNPNNPRLDTDCDGLSDAYEFSTTYPGGRKTDPNNPDSDGDGIPDGIEVAATSSVAGSGCPASAGDADPTTRTSPVNPDTDGDMINDGVEDANRNGRADADESNPLSRDSDGDGIPDNVEDANRNGRRDSGETNPARRDTDTDGIADGVEDANKNGRVDMGETNPLATDTDGDGLADGVEDSNHNGTREPTETDPRTPDSDCDGLSDGEEQARGTSPLNPDSDGDMIPDGVEAGRRTAVAGSTCPAFTGDQDSNTTTNPALNDSDMDGVPDGVEDTNHNGRVDMGELDPSNPDSDNDMIPDGDEILAGSNPLDPNSPNRDVGSGINAVCNDANLKVVNFNQGTMGGQWTLATEPTFAYAGVMVSDPNVAAGVIDDSTSGIAGFVVQMPVLAGAASTAVEQAQALLARVAAGSAATGMFTARQSPRNIMTHDGFQAAVSGVLDYAGVPGTPNAAAFRNRLLAIVSGLTTGAFAGLPTTAGTAGAEWVFQYEILVRPAQNQVLVVGAVLNRNIYDTAGDPRSIILDDLTNGTALAGPNARRSKNCDPFVATGQSIADFIWLSDISGSTDDDRGRISGAAQAVFNALANNGVNFRMGVVPHNENDITQGAGNGGDLRGVGFTRDPIAFATYLADTSGTDGCEFGLEAMRNAVTKALPRTPNGQPEDARKLRENAKLVTIYITDEHAQELTEDQCGFNPGGSACDTGIRDLFTDPAGDEVCRLVPNATQRACIDGILRPYIQQLQGQMAIAFAQTIDPNPPGRCDQGQFACPMSQQLHNEGGIGYVDVVNAMGGTFYSPCTANPGSSLQAIVSAVSGAASQYRLSGTPISATIKVGLTRMGSTNTMIVPRDKQNGFDYDSSSNTIFFRGGGFRPNENDRVTISYRVWRPAEVPCGGACAPNQVCNPQLGTCTCDTAACAANCGPNQVCDANCQCACAPDCNGQCGGNTVCNPTTCACECPANCGGACPTGTQCNQNTCQCDCTQNCGGACASAPNTTCDQASCSCQCPANCGGACGGNTLCNESTCSCTCDPSCTDGCPGMATCDPAANCACRCPTNCGGNCPDGTVCNQNACACECPANCAAGCMNRQVCDPNNRCQCVCPADCGGCRSNETCDPLNCRCVPIV